MLRRAGLLGAEVALAVLAMLATPAAGFTDSSETNLLSATPDGRIPNGPSRNGVLSQDSHVVRYAAYESDASDLVPGDTNGTTDVFVVSRGQPMDESGKTAPAWHAAGTQLVSTAMGGGPADGPSTNPDLAGDQMHRPHCVAFVSAADNLVGGDTNGAPDAFVKNLDTGTIQRVSINSAGMQADGPTSEVQVDGACDRVAFVAQAGNLALTSTSRAPAGPLVTGAPPPGTRQVYVRIIGSEPDDKGLNGTTFLASAAPNGVPAAGDAHDVAFGKLGQSCPQHCGTTSGDTLAFTAAASNLGAPDANGTDDVYERSFTVVEHRGRYGPLQTGTRLVSAGPSGQAGNGPSDQPSLNDSGRWVAFRTAATDLLPGDANNATDVALADLSGPRPALTQVSKSAATGPGNGPSGNPAVTRPGVLVWFESDATNLQSQGGPLEDRNDARDVDFWDIKHRMAWVESRDSDNHLSGVPDPGAAPSLPNADATNPATSAYANYFLFESSNPVLDRPLAERLFADLLGDPDQAALLAHTEPALHQVYERYFGPV